MTEAQHQMAVFKWSAQPHIRKKYPELKMLYHVPNGGRRDKIEAKHLKSQGVRKGVPDLDLPVPRKGYHGLKIEMKADKGRLSPEQKWWIEELQKQGYLCKVCFGWESAINILMSYLEG